MKTLLFLLAAALFIAPCAPAQSPVVPLKHRTPVTLIGECEVFANADNQYRLFLNGEQIMNAASFNTTQTMKMTLYRGDVITAWGKNFEQGTQGGLCVTILKGGKPILGSKDFRYAAHPNKADWQTSASLDGFKEPDFYVGTNAEVAGEKSPTMAWGKGGDRNTLELWFKTVVK